MLLLTESLQHVFVWPSENQRFGASDHEKSKKSPKGIRPHRCSPSPHGAKYITVTQDTDSSLCSERSDEDLFGRAKTAGLGQVTMTKKKWVLLDPVLTVG